MVKVLKGCARTGTVRVPSSKSMAHRLLICAALGMRKTEVICDGMSNDILATAKCLSALGAGFDFPEDKNTIIVTPAVRALSEKLLYCGESGSTLRFLLPVVGALGVSAAFVTEGRLSDRPIEPLASELCAHGMDIHREGKFICYKGRLTAGDYTLPGNVSSQYISGLLMAMPLLKGNSTLTVTGSIESGGYIDMTEDVLSRAGIVFEKKDNVYSVNGGQRFELPGSIAVEGDYSNAAFFLCMGAMSGEGVTVSGLDKKSRQGDRAVLDVLRKFGATVEESQGSVFVKKGTLNGITIDASPIPDLIPVLCVLGAVAEGTTEIINAGRLRIKESDRITATVNMLRALGADAEERPEGILIYGKVKLSGGTVETYNDHRIAMSAAAASCACTGEVVISGSECVNKSYPRFFEDFFDLTEVEA